MDATAALREETSVDIELTSGTGRETALEAAGSCWDECEPDRGGELGATTEVVGCRVHQCQTFTPGWRQRGHHY
ncbi:hypothetical protein E2C01_021958 [Portunus trituberculatus]|uniref:Uncharacterized protein n=1 Tax=Portunus trituberculatus TaxID=210409 RepID=A0A5B7E4S7_PORTR|nr:hypothetical protein [Portunus trituberculatus]